MENKNLKLEILGELYRNDIEALKTESKKNIMIDTSDPDSIKQLKTIKFDDKRIEKLYASNEKMKSKKYIDTHIWLSSDSFVYYYEEDRFIYRKLSDWKANYGEAFPKPLYDYLFKSMVSRYVVNVYPDVKTGIDYEQKRINMISEPIFKIDKNHKETPEQKKELDYLFEEFFYKVIASSNKDAYEYLINAMSAQIQMIKLKSVMYFYTAAEGVGKSTVEEFMRALLGGQYCKTNNNDFDYTGNFIGKTFLSVSETIEGFDYKKIVAIIKDLTTADIFAYRNLFQQSREFRCVNNVWLFTNHRIPELQGRRWAIYHVATHKAGDTKFWDRIYNVINDKKLLNCLAQRLLNRNIEDVNFGKVPMGDKLQIIKDNMRFTHQWLKNEYIFKKQSEILSRSEAFQKFEIYVKKNDRKIQKNTFFSDLKEIGIEAVRRSCAGGFSFEFDHIKLKERFMQMHYVDEDEIAEYERLEEEELKDYFEPKELQKIIKLESENKTLHTTILEQAEEIRQLKETIENIKIKRTENLKKKNEKGNDKEAIIRCFKECL